MPYRRARVRWSVRLCVGILAVVCGHPPVLRLAPGIVQAQTVLPLKADSSWKQIRSDDIVVVSNGGESVMRKALAEIEGFKHALRTLSPWRKMTSPVPTILVLFKDETSFDRYKPRDAAGRKRELVAGYFAERAHANYMVTYVQPGGALDLETILHEYTHFIVSRNLTVVPSWFNEGIADFYSTFSSTGHEGRPIVGRIPVDRLGYLKSGASVSLEQMLRPDHAYKLMRDERTVGAFYSQAWALVHYLIIGQDGRRDGQLNAYLSHIAAGRSLDDAFREAFRTTHRELEAELRNYVSRFSFQGLALTQPAPKPDAERPVASMLERDVLALHGDILVSVNALKDARSSLDRARALDGGHPGTLAALGRVEMGLDDNVRAVAVLRPAAEANPGDFGLHFYLGAALADADDYAGAADAFRQASRLVPESGTTWYQLSVALLALDRRAESDAALERATAADSRPVWPYARARAAWRLRLDATAIDDVAVALQRSHFDAESKAYAALVAAAASWRLQRPELALPLLTTARRATDEGSWTTKVLDFALGQMSGTDLLKAAKTSGEITEARAYWGLKLLFEGSRDAAMPHLTWVRDRGNKDYVEHGMVEDVLKDLAK